MTGFIVNGFVARCGSCVYASIEHKLFCNQLESDRYVDCCKSPKTVSKTIENWCGEFKKKESKTEKKKGDQC